MSGRHPIDGFHYCHGRPLGRFPDKAVALRLVDWRRRRHHRTAHRRTQRLMPVWMPRIASIFRTGPRIVRIALVAKQGDGRDR
jgi:hypothetical protein